jgi:hypothetical protein
MTPDQESEHVDLDAYCRAVEAHLCRKNDGHLIRVSGPAFEMVRGWAEQGIPLGVAKAGIDRTFERYYAKGPRRRPVHVSFCEADVVEAFDAWRRALGPSTGDVVLVEESSARASRSESLPAHLERVMNRLTLLRAPASGDRELDEQLEAAVRAIDAERALARQARGESRAALLARLAAIDDRLLSVARARLAPGREAELRREAEAELATFRERMPSDAYAAAHEAAFARLVRVASGLPLIRYEA